MDEINAINQVFLIIQRKTLVKEVYVKNLLKNVLFKNRCISTISQELYNTIKNTFSRNLMHPKVYVTKILHIQKYMQVYVKV